jgi:hypothetical protein
MNMLEINPAYTVSFEQIPAGYRDPADKVNTCMILDDFLLNPEVMVEKAIASAEKFHNPEPLMYPGVIMEEPVTIELVDAFEEIYKEHYPEKFKGIVEFRLRYSIVTTQPKDLKEAQVSCHIDSGRHNDLRAAGKTSISGVLYLFKNAAIGGTNFFRKLDDLFVPDLDPVDPPAYLTGSNRHYEMTNVVPAKWNRLILYPSDVWHSAHIEHPELLSTDPAKGRLTLNTVTICTV